MRADRGSRRLHQCRKVDALQPLYSRRRSGRREAFATLDSRLRKGSLGGPTTAIFVDTVGFIRKLPHHLVASFRSTLEEINQADVVLHVIDRHHAQWREHMEVGEEVLADLGIDMSRVLPVFNKMDRCGAEAGAVSGGLAISAPNRRRCRGVEGLPARAISGNGHP